ncbi:hypothetical protein Cgig2_030283 [Carnegiea gigantea]|uniref:Uncharacterized protein n=1 Tax=Carnegiea gigantea TaxID=171969 RepID=A0A9Q1GUE2_9CARY|nr:hypothetical protein Cgig2_030283 [Carnegiea gigantea]
MMGVDDQHGKRGSFHERSLNATLSEAVEEHHKCYLSEYFAAFGENRRYCFRQVGQHQYDGRNREECGRFVYNDKQITCWLARVKTLKTQLVRSLVGTIKSKIGNEEENENESRRIRRAISEQQRHIREAIAKGGGGNHEVTTYKGEDGKVRMKILVKKQDLKQILVAAAAAEATIINCNNQKQEEHHTHPSSSNKSSSSIIEQRLHDLMMSRKSRSSRRRRPSPSANAPWTPALHSIPEEHY